ncbi:MAG: hypothetical protein ABEI11_04100 [Haloarculaceae archaeon]
MATIDRGSDDRGSASDQRGFENYLPGGPRPSTAPGRVERFLTRLLRRRGRLRRVLVPKYRHRRR